MDMKNMENNLKLIWQEKTKLHKEKLIARLRFLVLIIGLILYLLIEPAYDLKFLAILALLIAYAGMILFFPPLHHILSYPNLATALSDNAIVFILCYFSGGLASPFILGFALPLLIFAVHPSRQKLFRAVALSWGIILLLAILTGFHPRTFVHLAATISVIAIFANILIYDEIRSLTSAAAKDGLTGLYTHKVFFDILHILTSPKSPIKHFSLVMIDLDDFKKLNDEKGHLVGDQALKDVAQALLHHLRDSDMVFRYGGDEFAVILPEVGYNLAKNIVERLRQAIINLGYSKSVSMGIAVYPEEEDNPYFLVELADKRMYAEKNPTKK
ncbi:diguanylate cyclase (GGDEF) domain-containing protein [Thermosyntropha lipolytica DSM 11003]|uniref:Diguanylate cyclase (GGDEF) domain-containing protein n=1 Tax=Thermosyntropha lipolytica DSM 11003 TaxID=1123382 RepID=A0A1M5RDR4_9FIRM|nr:GGDEF domain-containing protein [Thermosyntropha lipolytica]SHH23943.1 diguanylate cyclase (GGDEF) domain-containing protein [Thermosyntropha lipolytica DSM 11003]